MAVDIYCYIERLTDDGWVFSGDIGPNPEHTYDPESPAMAPIPAFHSVQKELAAILVDTGLPIRSTEPYQPIVARRGQPTDLGCVLRAYFEYYASDVSMVYSWFTADELTAFSLSSKTMIRRAYVDPDVAHLFADCPTDFPFSRWPQGRPIQYAEWIRDGIEVRWKESYASIVRDFAEVIPEALGRVGGALEARLIVQTSW